MPHTEAVLALDSEDATTAAFTATFEGHKNDNPYELWVALQGYDTDEVHRSQSYSQLRWNEQATVTAGDSCQITLPKNIDPAHPSLTYKAYVANFPDMLAAVSNTVAF